MESAVENSSLWQNLLVHLSPFLIHFHSGIKKKKHTLKQMNKFHFDAKVAPLQCGENQKKKSSLRRFRLL